MDGQSQKRGVKYSEADGGKYGQYPERSSTCVIHPTSGEEHYANKSTWLMKEIVNTRNMTEAYKRVMLNKGSPGIDGITCSAFKEYLLGCWVETKQQLITGTYHPQPVRRVEIPKPNGGVRMLGIPTLMDRLIQQAIHQVLARYFEPDFSDSSYGFRPNRRAAMAITQAKRYVREGRRWVIDMDLEKFFDKVNHDILMERVRRKVSDPTVLTLIRRYLKAGVMEDGLVTVNERGTPQGGPLSPLLSNILLDDLDKMLEKRGHKFCRYADDCNIYVKSEKAGRRVFESITRFIENKLQLRVNREKSAIDRPWRRKFLGFSFTCHMKTMIRVHEKSRENLRMKIKDLCRRGRGMNLETFIQRNLNPILRGWGNYFKHADAKTFTRDLDGWIRRRLRNILWRQWGKPRVKYRKMAAAGVTPKECYMSANSHRGPCFMSRSSTIAKALPASYFRKKGLISLSDVISRS